MMKNACYSYCGHEFWPSQTKYLKKCKECDNSTFLPVPACVICIVTMRDGGKDGIPDATLLVRRSIDPGKGGLVFPGGYIGSGETWQEACAREFKEETGIDTDPFRWEFRWPAHSANNRHLMLFCEYLVFEEEEYKRFFDGWLFFEPNGEVFDLILVTAASKPEEGCAFPTHDDALDWVCALDEGKNVFG